LVNRILREISTDLRSARSERLHIDGASDIRFNASITGWVTSFARQKDVSYWLQVEIFLLMAVKQYGIQCLYSTNDRLLRSRTDLSKQIKRLVSGLLERINAFKICTIIHASVAILGAKVPVGLYYARNYFIRSAHLRAEP
jgi:hypothetical protein